VPNAAEDGFTSELAREVAPDALERLLRYARIDTQSDPRSTSQPSSEKQLELSRLLVDELLELGVEDPRLDSHGFVLATVPPTTARRAPTVGLIAHVDTVPGIPSSGVRPQVIRYEGKDVPLPGDPSQVLRVHELPELADHIGHDLVTSDGTTLLGADDKGGIAEIMAAVSYLVRHPELEHGTVRIAFTPDEEIGKGIKFFDIEGFGAEVAYTLDGSTAGEIQSESFAALSATVSFAGRSSHPGSAKGVMVNAVRLAAEFVSRLPKDYLSPEATEGLEGFVHPGRIGGGEELCTVELILRDFDEERLAEHERLVRRLADEVAATEPGARVTVDVQRQFRNMREYLERCPRAVEAAEEAMRREGLEPVRSLHRGGTDGALLSERGLPTPNLFTGGNAYHSRREWICVQDMGAAVATIIHLVQVWAQ
jgi:tripeptide aminopeptidase